MNNITRTAPDHSAGVRPGGYKIHGSLTWTFHTLLASLNLRAQLINFILNTQHLNGAD